MSSPSESLYQSEPVLNQCCANGRFTLLPNFSEQIKEISCEQNVCSSAKLESVKLDSYTFAMEEPGTLEKDYFESDSPENQSISNSLNKTLTAETMKSYKVPINSSSQTSINKDDKLAKVIVKLSDSTTDAAVSKSTSNELPVEEEVVPTKLLPTFRKRARMVRRPTQPEPANQYIVDVPELWGIAPDGSAMSVFNKLEIKD